MLDAVAGLLKAEGSVHACGRDVSRLPTEKRGLAYVQSVPIDPPSAVDFTKPRLHVHRTNAIRTWNIRVRRYDLQQRPRFGKSRQA
ncbi:MAG: hypothetical protein QW680_13170 [Pyrobaculum sp.]